MRTNAIDPGGGSNKATPGAGSVPRQRSRGHVLAGALGAAQILAGAFVAILTSFGIAGIPGQASFLTTSVPIAIAMGVPIELTLLLLAVEVIPDIFRTVGNVTADVVVAAIIGRRHSREASEAADGSNA